MAESKGKKLQGKVVRLSSEKTIKVAVSDFVQDKKYKKYVKKVKKFLVHDPKAEAQEGDLVEILESRPYSKLKHFKLSKILKKAQIKE